MSTMTAITSNPLEDIMQRIGVTRKKPTAPEYLRSFGPSLSDIDGRLRWALDGKALQVWDDELRGRLEELIRENEAKIYKGLSIRYEAMIQHCWMLGCHRDFAHPTVVVCCDEPRLLKRIMRIIMRHQVLTPVGFELKGIPLCKIRCLADSILASTRPASEATTHSTTAAIPSTEDHSSYSHSKVVSSIRYHQPFNVCGSRLVVGGTNRETTLGGVISVGGVCYGLTVKHVLQDSSSQVEPAEPKAKDVRLYDSDWAEEDSSDSDSDCDVLDDDCNAKEEALSHSPGPVAQQDRDVALFMPGYGLFDDELPFVVKTSVAAPDHRDLDWALVKLDRRRVYLNNSVKFNALRVYPDSLVRLKSGVIDEEHGVISDIRRENTKRYASHVEILTNRGPVLGRSTGEYSSLKLKRTDRALSVWTFHMHHKLEIGDSGSWAVDTLSHELMGILIAGCQATKEAYIIPIHDVFADIERAMDAKSPVGLSDPPHSTGLHLSSLYAPSADVTDAASSKTLSNAGAYTPSSPATSVSGRSGYSSKSAKPPYKGHGSSSDSCVRYPCLYPGCDHTAGRSYDLERHMSTHYPEQVQHLDCPYARNGFCGRMGEKGFTREDHRQGHIRKVHLGATMSSE